MLRGGVSERRPEAGEPAVGGWLAEIALELQQQRMEQQKRLQSAARRRNLTASLEPPRSPYVGGGAAPPSAYGPASPPRRSSLAQLSMSPRHRATASAASAPRTPTAASLPRAASSCLPERHDRPPQDAPHYRGPSIQSSTHTAPTTASPSPQRGLSRSPSPISPKEVLQLRGQMALLEQQWLDEKAALQAEVNRLHRQHHAPPAALQQQPAAAMEILNAVTARHEALVLDIIPHYVHGCLALQASSASEREMLLQARQLELAADLEAKSSQLEALTACLDTTRGAHSESAAQRDSQIAELTSELESLGVQNASLGNSLLASETLQASLKEAHTSLERTHAAEAAKRRDAELGQSKKAAEAERLADEVREARRTEETLRDELRRATARLEEEGVLRRQAEAQYDAMHTQYLSAMQDMVEERARHSTASEDGRHNSVVAEAQRAELAARAEGLEGEVASLRQKLSEAAEAVEGQRTPERRGGGGTHPDMRSRVESIQRATLHSRKQEAECVASPPSAFFSPMERQAARGADGAACIRFSPHCCFVAEGLSIAVSPESRLLPPVTIDVLFDAEALRVLPDKWRIDATLVSLSLAAEPAAEEGASPSSPMDPTSADRFYSHHLASARVDPVDGGGEGDTQLYCAVFEGLTLPGSASGCRIAFTLVTDAAAAAAGGGEEFPSGPTICTGALFICGAEPQLMINSPPPPELALRGGGGAQDGSPTGYVSEGDRRSFLQASLAQQRRRILAEYRVSEEAEGGRGLPAAAPHSPGCGFYGGVGQHSPEGGGDAWHPDGGVAGGGGNPPSYGEEGDAGGQLEATKLAAQRLLRYKLGRLRKKHELGGGGVAEAAAPAGWAAAHQGAEPLPPKRGSKSKSKSRSASTNSRVSPALSYRTPPRRGGRASAEEELQWGVGGGVPERSFLGAVPSASAMLARLEERMLAILRWSLIPDPELKGMIEGLLEDVQGLKMESSEACAGEEGGVARSPSPRLPPVAKDAEAPSVKTIKELVSEMNALKVLLASQRNVRSPSLDAAQQTDPDVGSPLMLTPPPSACE